MKDFMTTKERLKWMRNPINIREILNRRPAPKMVNGVIDDMETLFNQGYELPRMLVKQP